MNDKEILMENGAEQQNARVSRHSVSGAILAALLCILLAGLVWVCVMNTTDTDFIPVRAQGAEGYECTLSVDGVEVEGKVSALRNLDEVVVTIPDGLAPGTYYVPVEMLALPEGVTPSGVWSATVTVKAK